MSSVNPWRLRAEKLFQVLDSIDTASDIAKSNLLHYGELVRRELEKVKNVVVVDGAGVLQWVPTGTIDNENEVEQLRVQLAGCGTAALGSVEDVAVRGDYGWSPAYEDTLRLRLRFDALYDILSSSYDRNELPEDVREVFMAVRKDMRSGAGVSAARDNSSLKSLYTKG
jgi:hypothetical protein